MFNPLKSLKQRTRRAITGLVRGEVGGSDILRQQLSGDFQNWMNTSSSAKTGQLTLVNQYRTMAAAGMRLPDLSNAEFRAFSQNGEDGILLYLFAILGTTNKVVIEICAGDGIQCNSANLILNHGWHGLLVDGNPELVRKGKEFYALHPDTFTLPPQFIHAWIDKETVNDLIGNAGFSGEVDLLSIDVDGVDYWLWEAITVINPRVIVTEVQCIWGPQPSLTVAYDPAFQAPTVNGLPLHAGATLQAFVKLARRKGYRLVGVNSLGINAFFVREDISHECLPEVSAEKCLDKPFVHWAMKNLLPCVKDENWVTVD